MQAKKKLKVIEPRPNVVPNLQFMLKETHARGFVENAEHESKAPIAQHRLIERTLKLGDPELAELVYLLLIAMSPWPTLSCNGTVG